MNTDLWFQKPPQQPNTVTLGPIFSLILQDTHEVLTSLIGSHALLTRDVLPVLAWMSYILRVTILQFY